LVVDPRRDPVARTCALARVDEWLGIDPEALRDGPQAVRHIRHPHEESFML
jgi:hypothetical protein